MGLFNWKKKSSYHPPSNNEKPMDEYKIMEQVYCDLDAALSNANPGFNKYCRLIAESPKYLFYSYGTYKDNSGGWVIRRSKDKPSEKLFFGQNYPLTCVFDDYLIQCHSSGERGRFFIYTRNFYTGDFQKWDWLGQGNVDVLINGFGRSYVQDTIQSMTVVGNELVLKITRKKSTDSTSFDPHDIDTEYTLKVNVVNGQFMAHPIFKEDQNSASVSLAGKINSTNRQQKQPSQAPGMGLGRDSAKHISCDYVGHEKDCPRECAKCAISLKTDGDIALASGNPEQAVRHYKKAVFVEPKFAEAWLNMGNAYGMSREYNNALSAFNKAISIVPTYGKALFGKAITLKNLGKTADAIEVLDAILLMYDDPDVRSERDKLLGTDKCSTQSTLSVEDAESAMTEKALEICKKNNLFDKEGRVIPVVEIYRKKEFSQSVFSYCKKIYSSLGAHKVWSESILAGFYGSLCTTLLFYRDSDGFRAVEPFDYLANHLNLEELDRNAEKFLGIKPETKEAEDLWNMVYQYVTYCLSIIANVNPTQAEHGILDATESAYVMGMLYAMRYHEKDSMQQRSAIDEALIRLAESTKSKDYKPSPERIRYSIEPARQVPAVIICHECRRPEVVQVNEAGGREQQELETVFRKYQVLAAQFTELGFSASVKHVCNYCAIRRYRAYSPYGKPNLVFSIIRPDCGKTVNSYPSISWFEERPYQIALAFIKGADTVMKLSKATGTQLIADDYLYHVHEVLGKTSDQIR